MPRDVEILVPPHHASAEPAGEDHLSGDASILAILGVFVMVDALLVILYLV